MPMDIRIDKEKEQEILIPSIEMRAPEYQKGRGKKSVGGGGENKPRCITSLPSQICSNEFALSAAMLWLSQGIFGSCFLLFSLEKQTVD